MSPKTTPARRFPTDTASAYGAAKRVSEYLCASYSQVYGLEATVARLFAFIGLHLPLDPSCMPIRSFHVSARSVGRTR
jgi:nucleoside-diphosphate-sugar epimerase